MSSKTNERLEVAAAVETPFRGLHKGRDAFFLLSGKYMYLVFILRCCCLEAFPPFFLAVFSPLLPREMTGMGPCTGEYDLHTTLEQS